MATAVLQLVDEGKLSLDDTLEPFVPGIPNGKEITIRQLLGMTAGIFNYVEDPAFEEEYSSNPLMSFSPEDAVEIVKRHQPNFAPGERLLYCDTNYILLGLIMQQVTGQIGRRVDHHQDSRTVGIDQHQLSRLSRHTEAIPQGLRGEPGLSQTA